MPFTVGHTAVESLRVRAKVLYSCAAHLVVDSARGKALVGSGPKKNKLENPMQHRESKSGAKSRAETLTAARFEGAGGRTRDLEPSLDSSLRALKDWQEFMQIGADLINENIKSTADDLKGFSE